MTDESQSPDLPVDSSPPAGDASASPEAMFFHSLSQRAGKPRLTYAIIGVCIVVFVLMFFAGMPFSTSSSARQAQKQTEVREIP